MNVTADIFESFKPRLSSWRENESGDLTRTHDGKIICLIRRRVSGLYVVDSGIGEGLSDVNPFVLRDRVDSSLAEMFQVPYVVNAWTADAVSSFVRYADTILGKKIAGAVALIPGTGEWMMRAFAPDGSDLFEKTLRRADVRADIAPDISSAVIRVDALLSGSGWSGRFHTQRFPFEEEDIGEE